MVYAKCQNPACSHESFALSIPGVARYQRATSPLLQEAVAGLVADNTTLARMGKRITRSFNMTGSKSALARWKRRVARQVDFPALLSRLEFSGALCLDEFMPRRGGRYEQLAGDAKTIRLLYLEPVPAFYGRGVTEAFCRQLDRWGITPSCVVFDLLTTFPRVVAKVWPAAHQQFDHFHVMQWLWHLRNALIQFRRSLQGPRWQLHREELWEMRWGLLKQMDRWSPKDRLLIPEMMELYAGTVVEQVLLFKEVLWYLFDGSASNARGAPNGTPWPWRRGGVSRGTSRSAWSSSWARSSTAWSPTSTTLKSLGAGTRRR
jgi:transposase